MATKKTVKVETAAPAKEWPVFVLRADRPGHLRALMATREFLPLEDQALAASAVREFELYEGGR